MLILIFEIIFKKLILISVGRAVVTHTERQTRVCVNKQWETYSKAM